jgi:hypothetical protein
LTQRITTFELYFIALLIAFINFQNPPHLHKIKITYRVGMMLRNILGRSNRRTAILARAVRTQSTQVERSSVKGPIATDGRHEIDHAVDYEHDSESVK